MADFQTDILDKIAQIVGGTVSGNDAHFFDDHTASSPTGVAGLKGCYSAPPRSIGSTTPVGIVIPGRFTADLASQGGEDNEDHVRLLILVAPYDPKAQMPILSKFRDTIPAAFRAHMQATFNGTPSPGTIDFFVTDGSAAVHEWGGIPFYAWEFTVRVRRMMSVTYTA